MYDSMVCAGTTLPLLLFVHSLIRYRPSAYLADTLGWIVASWCGRYTLLMLLENGVKRVLGTGRVGKAF